MRTLYGYTVSNFSVRYERVVKICQLVLFKSEIIIVNVISL